MLNKKKEEEKPVEFKKLTEIEFFEFHLNVEQMKNANLKLSCSKLERDKMKLIQENMKLTLQLQAISQKPLYNGVKESEDEYHKFKKKIESRLGISLDGKMIDEFTYEVKPVPSDK